MSGRCQIARIRSIVFPEWAGVLALATDEEDYRRLVTEKMESIGLFIAEVEDLGRYSEFTSCADTIVESFHRLSDEWPVQYHTFHTTMIDDA